jgi:hypothetical protein
MYSGGIHIILGDFFWSQMVVVRTKVGSTECILVGWWYYSTFRYRLVWVCVHCAPRSHLIFCVFQYPGRRDGHFDLFSILLSLFSLLVMDRECINGHSLLVKVPLSWYFTI